MAEIVKHHDFIELDYTGKLEDGMVFDTTQKDVAKEKGLPHENLKPAIVCVGEGQLLPGLDKALEGKEVGKKFTVTLEAEDAFGKRDVKNMQIIPISTFKDNKLNPHPGFQFDDDQGRRGVVTRVAGGRVIVNYNHPLSGKKVIYDVEINRKVTDAKDQIQSFLSATLRMPNVPITVAEDKAVVELPMALPPQFTDSLAKKLVELTSLKEIEFKAKENNA